MADIYLQTFARDRHDLSATRVQALEAVAFQCPIEGNGWWEIGGEALIFTTDFFTTEDTEGTEFKRAWDLYET